MMTVASVFILSYAGYAWWQFRSANSGLQRFDFNPRAVQTKPDTDGKDQNLIGPLLVVPYLYHGTVVRSVTLPDGRVEHPPLGSGDPIDAFADKLTQAVEAVASGRAAPGLSCDLARDALSICHAEVESVKTGQPIAIA